METSGGDVLRMTFNRPWPPTLTAQPRKKGDRQQLFIRLNKEIKHRTNVVEIFVNDASIIRLVGSQLLEQQEE